VRLTKKDQLTAKRRRTRARGKSKLRAVRLAQGMTVSTLAASASVNLGDLASYEAEARKPSVPELMRLAAALGVTPAELIK
jgi:transcriptional regulator with XRE-family HTH domain